MGDIVRFFPKIFPEFFLRILCLGDPPPFLRFENPYMGGIREGGPPVGRGGGICGGGIKVNKTHPFLVGRHIYQHQ
jgi:hypothetical protein